MTLDPLTLMVAEVIASAVASLFLLGAALRFREVHALRWWTIGHVFHTVGLILLIAGIVMRSDILSPVGAGLMSMTPVLVWAGVRRFFNRTTPWPVIIGAPFALLLVTLLPVGLDRATLSAGLGFAFWPVFLVASSWLLLTNRGERLLARWSLSAILMLHASVFTMAVIEVITGRFPFNEPPAIASPFGVVHFESLLFSMGAALTMILICRERHELNFVAASRIDPLTGSNNRSAFFEIAERMLYRDRKAGAPCSLIMFDLDRFKAINDNYGHQLGDRVLHIFAETVRLSLRPRDLFGRYGGEEFLVILPGTSLKTATLIAERIRQAFADTGAYVDGQPVRATVSAGVTTANGEQILEDLIRYADKAMYAAKQAGRNRVEVSHDDDPDNGVVRIA